MDSENVTSRFMLAIAEASLETIPPELRVATGHDETVMLFLLSVVDAKATTETLMDVVTLSEADSVLRTLRATSGLIRKRLHIDDAYRLRDRLDSVGTAVEFIRPDDLESV